MKHLRLFTLCLLSMFVLGQSALKSADAPIVGGYRTVDATDKQVTAAADFAVRERSKSRATKLLKVMDAKQQVVAGMNYQLVLQVQQGTAVFQATAVVYVDLKGHKKLTSWHRGTGR